jgi:hypothetical protein
LTTTIRGTNEPAPTRESVENGAATLPAMGKSLDTGVKPRVPPKVAVVEFLNEPIRVVAESEPARGLVRAASVVNTVDESTTDEPGQRPDLDDGPRPRMPYAK